MILPRKIGVAVPSSYPDKKIPIKNWCFWDFKKGGKIFEKDFIIIPRELMKDNGLTKSDCFLFGNIYNLSRLNGYCFATNKVLSNLSFVKIRTINYSLKRLKEKGYINVERVKNDDLIQRRIYVNDMQDDSG